MSTRNSIEPGLPRPPELVPPGNHHPRSSQNKKTPSTVLFLILFTFLLICAGVVLTLLPDLIQKNPSSSVSVMPETSSTEIPENDPEENVDPLSDPSEQILNTISASVENLLSLQARAESDNIGIWAADEYKEILNSIGQADHSFKASNYDEAMLRYEKALSQLSSLLESESDIFKKSIFNGQQALAEEHSEEALRHFSIAMAIDPDSPDAQNGLKRAGTLKTVVSMYKEAQRHEQLQEFKDAETLLEDILGIDETYLPAKDTLADIRAIIRDQQLTQDLGVFYSSLEEGNLSLAQQKLNSLSKLASSHPEVIRAEELLTIHLEAARINQLQERAENQSRQEKWKDALSTYEEALTIAPDALFAVNGRDNAAKRLELDTAMIDVLNQPQRLQDKNSREAAARLVHYAEQFTAEGPRLNDQIARLKDMLVFAETPVPVTIESDGLTEISIYHVGRMGRFRSRQLILHPGTYTVVGSRVGFRDTRTTIEVDPNNADNRFFIQCKEPI